MASAKPRTPLSAMHQRFVDEYLVDRNAGKAYQRAGYKARGNAADVNAARLLRKAQIIAAVAKGEQDRANRVEITQDRVLIELGLLAFSDVTHYQVADDGTVTLAPNAPAAAMRALQSIKRRIVTKGKGKDRERTVDVEIRLWDKPGPLKLAGQHVGLFAEQHERRGKNGKVIDKTVVTFGGRYKPARESE